MASKHRSSDYSEVKDVTQLLLDFEEHNAVSVAIGFFVVTRKNGPRIVMSAEAFTNPPAFVERARLAYAEIDTYAINLRHWAAAVTHLLYVLDSKLAFNDMQPPGENRA